MERQGVVSFTAPCLFFYKVTCFNINGETLDTCYRSNMAGGSADTTLWLDYEGSKMETSIVHNIRTDDTYILVCILNNEVIESSSFSGCEMGALTLKNRMAEKYLNHETLMAISEPYDFDIVCLKIG